MGFGQRLKSLRKDRRLTLRDLGKLSDLDHAYIWRLEMGAKTSPSKQTIRLLSKGLHLNKAGAITVKGRNARS